MPVSKPRPRPAHTEGTTRCAYTPDGSRLVTVGSNNTIRVYRTGHDGEPANVDECPEQNTCVAAADDFFVVGAEDGTVSLYTARPGSQTPPEFDRFLVRCSLPVRDVALSPNDGGAWCAVASDELTVKLVHTRDASRPVRTLREHARPTKHLAFDTKGSILALSCTDGVVYFYSLTADEPELMRKVDGVAARLETDTDASSAIAWHPDGRAFAVPTATRDVQVVGARDDWERQRSFANGHTGDVTALAWSPNGALLATAGRDRKLLLWETKTQSVVARYDYAGVQDIRWHPHVGKNLVSFTNAMGEVYICPDFVPEQFAGLLQLPTQPAPFIHDPLKSGSGNAGRRQEGVNGHKTTLAPRPRRRGGSPGSVDSFDEEARGGVFGDDDDDDFVVDDDGAGYALNGNKKRSRDEDGLDEQNGRSKRLYVSEEAAYHEPFQPGSTPWRGNRKYLCLNLVGFVWTIDQGSHHTVTVEFYDHDLHRDFHFTDTFRYDKACLNHHGALFSNEPADEDGKDGVATVFYRPHETWTQRSDWRTQLPRGERVVAISLSESFVTVATDRYIRIFTLFGIPYRVYRPKNAPVVTCTSWKDYVMTVSNGPSGPDGYTKLVYSIEDVKHDEIIQNEDIVALPEDATLKSVFFSDKGVS